MLHDERDAKFEREIWTSLVRIRTVRESTRKNE